jgi:hypothetical protein
MASFEGGRGAEDGGKDQRHTVDSAREVLEVGGDPDSWAPPVSGRAKIKRGEEAVGLAGCSGGPRGLRGKERPNGLVASRAEKKRKRAKGRKGRLGHAGARPTERKEKRGKGEVGQ